MKPVFTLFLVLCFCLQGGVGYAHTGSPALSGTLSLTRVGQGEKPEALAHTQAKAIMPVCGLNQENDDVLYVEEDDKYLVKKQVSRYVLFLSDVYFSNCQSGYPGYRSIGRYLSPTGSCKYIVQRVLRI